jgi:hypothetical protein
LWNVLMFQAWLENQGAAVETVAGEVSTRLEATARIG